MFIMDISGVQTGIETPVTNNDSNTTEAVDKKTQNTESSTQTQSVDGVPQATEAPEGNLGSNVDITA